MGRKVIQIEKRSVTGNWHKRGDIFNFLCSAGLRRRVELPADLKFADLVFTERRGLESFKIGVRKSGSCTSDYFVAALPRTGLYAGFHRALRDAYGEGYRYFHFEY